MSTEIYLHLSAQPIIGDDKIHITTAPKNYAHMLEVIQKIVDADDSGKYELVVMPSAMLREEFKARQKSRADGEEHWHDSITGCKNDQFTIFAQPKSGLS